MDNHHLGYITKLKKKKKLERKAHDTNPKPRCKLGFNSRSNSRIQVAFK